MYEKILVPHAGTKAGNKALSHAKKLAKIHNAELTILHIVERIPEPSSFTFDHGRSKWKDELKKAKMEMKKEMEENMQKLVDELKRDNVTASVKVVEGYPEEEIARISNDQEFDLVVMAKRRKLRGIKSILKLGSVSRKVLERVACPVLLIEGGK